MTLVVAGCASNPKQTLAALDEHDPKFETVACAQSREAALKYDNKTVGRVGVGLALGLLGPIGLIPAVGMDVQQNQERKLLNDEIHRRCQSDTGADIGPVTQSTINPNAVPVANKATTNLMSYGAGFGSAMVILGDRRFTIYMHKSAPVMLVQPKIGQRTTGWPDQIWADAGRSLTEPVGCAITQIAPISRIGASWEVTYNCPANVDLRKLIMDQRETLKQGAPLHP